MGPKIQISLHLPDLDLSQRTVSTPHLTLTNDKTLTKRKIVKQLTVCSGAPDHTVWANIFLHSIVNKMEMELCIYVQLLRSKERGNYQTEGIANQ